MKKSRLWNRYIEARSPHIHIEYKRVRNEVRKQARLREKKEQCEVAKQCKSNPKKFWKYLNSKSKSQTRIGNIKTVGADKRILIANDDEDKANIFGDYFTVVYTRESKDEFNELPPRCLAFPCDDLFFSEEVILDKLNNVKVSKSQALIRYILLFYMR